jgi:hypothetical protein
MPLDNLIDCMSENDMVVFKRKKKVLGSAIANLSEPKSHSGRVFNFKLGSFAT